MKVRKGFNHDQGRNQEVVAAGVRAVKTAAQTALAAMGTTVVSITALDWPQIAALAATAAVASVLTSIVGVPEVEEGTSPLSKQQ